jgi:hypothetical protein
LRAYAASEENRERLSRLVRKPPVQKACVVCGVAFQHRSMGKRNALVVCCSRKCAREKGVRACHKALRGNPAPWHAERMRQNNPMANPATRAKMQASLTGRTFLARGGNGKTTAPQRLLAEALGLPMEYAIATASVKDAFASLPPCYKVDIADPERMLAIEVDGKTHKTRKWQHIDARKESVLRALGWSVLRFWNQEALTDTARVLADIRTYTTSK